MTSRNWVIKRLYFSEYEFVLESNTHSWFRLMALRKQGFVVVGSYFFYRASKLSGCEKESLIFLFFNDSEPLGWL